MNSYQWLYNLYSLNLTSYCTKYSFFFNSKPIKSLLHTYYIPYFIVTDLVLSLHAFFFQFIFHWFIYQWILVLMLWLCQKELLWGCLKVIELLGLCEFLLILCFFWNQYHMILECVCVCVLFSVLKLIGSIQWWFEQKETTKEQVLERIWWFLWCSSSRKKFKLQVSIFEDRSFDHYIRHNSHFFLFSNFVSYWSCSAF